MIAPRPPPSEPSEPSAARLAAAITQVRARLREVDRAVAPERARSQLEILYRLSRDGPATAAALAAVQQVTDQAIAQSLSALKRDGLVSGTSDESDRRKKLVHVTEAGRAEIASVIAARTEWLAEAVDETAGSDDPQALERVIAFLERLAAAGSDTGGRRWARAGR